MAKKVVPQNGEEPQVKQINANTQIVFTIKSFFGLIGTMLGLFFGFYMLVVVPKVDKTEQHYETMFTEQKEQNRIFYEKLGNIDNSIGGLNSSIEALTKQSNTHQPIANTGGSFGGGIAANGGN